MHFAYASGDPVCSESRPRRKLDSVMSRFSNKAMPPCTSMVLPNYIGPFAQKERAQDDKA
jgi:hypothetical protein